MNRQKLLKVSRKLGKMLLWIFGILLILLLSLILLVKVPAIQNRLVNISEKYLSDLLSTEVTIESVAISFPKKVVINQLMLFDQQKDTLLSISSLLVDTDLFGLLNHEIFLNSVEIKDLVSNVYRHDDDLDFNYQFIINQFSSNDSPNTSDARPWQFKLDQIETYKIRFSYVDASTKTNLRASWDNLNINFQEFSIDSNRYYISDALISGMKADFTNKASKTKSIVEATDENHNNLDFRISSLEVRNSDYDFNTLELKLNGYIGILDISTKVMDLMNNEIALQDVSLKSSSFKLRLDTAAISDEEVTETTPWMISLDVLELDENVFAMDLGPPDTLDGEFDFRHMVMEDIHVQARDLSYNHEDILASIDGISFNLNRAFQLTDLRGGFKLNKYSLEIDNAILQTPSSELFFKGKSNFQSFDSLLSKKTKITVKFDQSFLGISDLVFFYPELPRNLQGLQKADFSVDIHGTLDDLVAEAVSIDVLSETTVLFRGQVMGLVSEKGINAKIDELQMLSSGSDMSILLADSLISDRIKIPERIAASFIGNASNKSIKGDFNILSDFGDINIAIDSFRFDTQRPGYDFKITTDSLDVGKLTHGNDQLNNLNAAVRMRGSGFDPDSLDTFITGTINHIVYNQYVYDSLMIDAHLVNRFLEGDILMKDENLDFHLRSKLVMASPDHYQVLLDLRKVDLEPINFSKTPLTVKFHLTSDITNDDLRHLNGKILVENFFADNGIDVYEFDSLLVAGISQKNQTEITIDSDIMAGRFQGNISLAELPEMLTNHLNKYYQLSAYELPVNNMNFTFDFDFKKTDLWTNIVFPSIGSIEPGRLKASFDGNKNQLMVDFNVKNLDYSGVKFDNITMKLNSDDNHLVSDLTIDNIYSSNMQVNSFSLIGNVSQNEITTRILTRDSSKTINYFVKGRLKKLDSIYQLKIQSDSLILANQRWQVNEGNYLRFGKGDLFSNGLVIRNGSQKVEFEVDNLNEAQLKINFEQFSLVTIGQAINKNSELLKGVLNGYVALSLPPNPFSLTSNLSIDDFSYLQKQWGDITLSVNEINASRYKAALMVKSGKNDIALETEYSYSPQNPLNLDLNVNQFDLSTIAPLTPEMVTNLTGSLQGKLTILDALNTPDISGTINLINVKGKPVALNNPLSIEKAVIGFDKSSISLGKIMIKDETERTATLQGSMKINDWNFHNLNLQIDTQDFLILNTSQEDNGLFYGTLRTDGTAIIKGTSIRPQINLKMKVSDGSKLTYIVPQSETNELNQHNIVRFVNKDSSEVANSEKILVDSLGFEGLDLTAQIEINDQSSFTIVMDPLSGDQLFVKGNADMTMEINTKGDIQLAGQYTLTEGLYKFSFYKLVQREFNVEKGSSIVWTGNPYEATMDVNANHRVETTPIDLMINQINQSNETLKNQYRQQMPFIVNLHIEGQLLQPSISFNLDMPEENRGAFNGNVYARIRDINTRESELNKQVFALLVLKRFISENPLQSEGGQNLEDNTRRSVSRILTDQLNRLTDNIQNIDLTLALDSYQDFSTGQAENTTELELGVSKNLFDDQLTVKVSGNVNLEGGNQQHFTDYVGDLVLEYKITEDGRLRITGFRKNDYDILSGEIVETGAGLIYVRDYNTFKELFRNLEKK